MENKVIIQGEVIEVTIQFLFILNDDIILF